MPTADQLNKSITPGSTEYGERASLEQGLAQIASAPTGGGGPAPAATPGGSAIPPGPESPLGTLLSGGLTPEPTPLTDGLSVGSGRGPTPEPNPWTDNYTERLRYLAQFAKTPMLRAQARAALRYRVRGGDIQ